MAKRRKSRKSHRKGNIFKKCGPKVRAGKYRTMASCARDKARK
jgi:hypothetical protein